MVDIHRHKRETKFPPDVFDESAKAHPYEPQEYVQERAVEAFYWYLAESFYLWSKENLSAPPIIKPYVFTASGGPVFFQRTFDNITPKGTLKGERRVPERNKGVAQEFWIHAPSVTLSWYFLKPTDWTTAETAQRLKEEEYEEGEYDWPYGIEVHFYVIDTDLVPAIMQFAKQLENEIPQRLSKGIELKRIEIHVFE